MHRLAIFGVLLSGVVLGGVLAKAHTRYMLAQARSASICSDVPCDYLNRRKNVIESHIAQISVRPTYLVIGDSIVERGMLPTLCNRHPVNAGIGSATVATFELYAHRLVELLKPDFVVVALGTNDTMFVKADDFYRRLKTLVASMGSLPVIVVPLPPGPDVSHVVEFNAAIATLQGTKAKPLESVQTLPDGVHLTAAAYEIWTQRIADAVLASTSIANCSVAATTTPQ